MRPRTDARPARRLHLIVSVIVHTPTETAIPWMLETTLTDSFPPVPEPAFPIPPPPPSRPSMASLPAFVATLDRPLDGPATEPAPIEISRPFRLGAVYVAIGLGFGIISALAATGAAALLLPPAPAVVFPAPIALPPAVAAAERPAEESPLPLIELPDTPPPVTTPPVRMHRVRSRAVPTKATSSTLDALLKR